MFRHVVWCAALFSACSSSSNSASPESTSTDSSGELNEVEGLPTNQSWGPIGREGGRIEITEGDLAGLTVEVPEGALEEAVLFTAKVVETPTDGLDEMSASKGPSIELEPHDVVFSKDVIVTLPVEPSSDGDPEDPIMVLKTDGESTQLLFADDPSTVVDEGRITVGVRQFSIFTPIVRFVGGLLDDIAADLTCGAIDLLGTDLIDFSTNHMFVYSGAALTTDAATIQASIGADVAADIVGHQVGVFAYSAAGRTLGLGSIGGSFYSGIAFGDTDNINDAWGGSIASFSISVDVLSILTLGGVSLSTGATGFTTCTDPEFDPLLFFKCDEYSMPGSGDVWGCALSVGIGVGVPFAETIPGDVSLETAFAKSWPTMNDWLSKTLDAYSVGNTIALDGEGGSYVSIDTVDGSEESRGWQMARVFGTIYPPNALPATTALGVITVLSGRARDEGKSLAGFCGLEETPDEPENCGSECFHYDGSCEASYIGTCDGCDMGCEDHDPDCDDAASTCLDECPCLSGHSDRYCDGVNDCDDAQYRSCECDGDNRITGDGAYDNVDPESTSCVDDAVTVDSVDLYGYAFGEADYVATLDLRYSPSCRTVWARITTLEGLYAAGDWEGGQCWIHRNSDGAELEDSHCSSDHTVCYTNMLDDADVSCYAYGTVDSIYGIAVGQTLNYK